MSKVFPVSDLEIIFDDIRKNPNIFIDTASTYINYYGTSKPVTTGALTWSVVADTPSTLLWVTVDEATLIATGKLAYTSTTTYRINANNTLTALFKVIELSSGFTGGAGDFTINETYQ